MSTATFTPSDWLALGLQASTARGYYELGRALHTSGAPREQEAAIQALNLAHALQPRAAAYTELGIVLKARGRRDEAVHALRKAAAFTPNEPSAYLHLGALLPPREASVLVRTAIALLPTSGSAYLSLAATLRSGGDLAAAQEAADTAASLEPAEPRLAADWRHWHMNWERTRQAARDDEAGGGGIGYDSSLQFPWRGVELRARAEAQFAAARERLPPLPPHQRAMWPAAPSHRLTRGTPLRVAYIGSLSDEPQLRAMGALFRGADMAVARLTFHAVTAAPTPTPDYLAYFGACRGSSVYAPLAATAAELAERISVEAPHIVLDGLWRRECLPSDADAVIPGERSAGGAARSGVAGGGVAGGGASDGRQLTCALLHRPAPLTFGVLAAPITGGGAHVHYTLGDPACLPPRLAPAFAERFVLLPVGAYPFSHASWAAAPFSSSSPPSPSPWSSASSWAPSSSSSSATPSSTWSASALPRRAAEGLRRDAPVLASFVQRWKLNPIAWPAWTNVLRRGPVRSTLWLLQHPLDAAGRDGLSRMLAAELADLRRSRLVVMRRQPLAAHVRRTGLADLVLDTWPYTAHTTAADGLWAAGEPMGGPPWLSLAASDDRMDSLLSRAVLQSLGGLPLVSSTWRGFEDTAVAFLASRAVGQRVL